MVVTPFKDFLIIREHTLISLKEDENIQVLLFKPQLVISVTVSVRSG